MFFHTDQFRNENNERKWKKLSFWFFSPISPFFHFFWTILHFLKNFKNVFHFKQSKKISRWNLRWKKQIFLLLHFSENYFSFCHFFWILSFSFEKKKHKISTMRKRKKEKMKKHQKRKRELKNNDPQNSKNHIKTTLFIYYKYSFYIIIYYKIKN